MRSTRLVWWLLVACVLAFGGARVATGHGHRYRDPDLSPPPAPWEVPPESPPSPPPPRTPSLPVTDWLFWWQMNSARYEDLEQRLQKRPDAAFAREADRGVRHAIRARPEAMRDVGRPALMRLLRGDETDGHVRAAALLALGKQAEDATHVRLLLRALLTATDDPTGEAAALALGLLRRADAGDRLPADLLLGVREALFAAIEAPVERMSDRVAGAAALALGLLGDQPVAGDDGERMREVHTGRLFTAFQAHRGDAERAVPLLAALGGQPPDSLTSDQRACLEGVIRDRRGAVSTQAWAAYALGRVGDGASLDVLLAVLEQSARGDGALVRAAVSAHVCLARSGRLGEADRTRAIEALRRVSGAHPGTLVRGLALLGLGQLGAKHRHLLARARSDDGEQDRAFAALAVGLAAHRITDHTEEEALQAWREKALPFLRETVADPETPPRLCAASCIALGLAGWPKAGASLLPLLAAEDPYDQLAGTAAWGLGLLGVPTRESTKALQRAATSASPELRRRSVRALALLGNPLLPGDAPNDVVALLLKSLAAEQTVVERRDILVLLARFGDARAFGPLVGILEDQEEPSLLRALAASALGSIGDLAWISSLDRLREDANYFALTDVLRRALRYL